jgi:DNA-binding MltR family transcriptional regulator
MGWLTLRTTDGHTFYNVLDEIKDGSPRATGVVAAAFVEDHLTQVVKQRFVQTPVSKDKNPVEDMFRGGGPLSDFSNKIDLAYLLSRISKDACRELHSIRRIRNAFAHKMEVADFDVPEVADRCTSLTRWEEIKVKMRPADKEKKGNVILTIGPVVEEGEQDLPVVDLLPNEEVKTPRDRYIAACQFYIAVFSIIIQDQKNLIAPLV